MEAFKMARTLKEGLAQLKARADPHARSLVSPRRALRTVSAASSMPRTLSAQRCYLDMPHYGSFSSDSSDGPGGSSAAGLLQTRPMPLHASLSCPQRARDGRPSAALHIPAPRFELAEPRGALGDASATLFDRHEVAEAAETMILFMRSESSSQNEPSSPQPTPQPQLRNTADPLPPTAAADGNTTTSESIHISDSDCTGHLSPPPQPPGAKRAHTNTDAADRYARPRRRTARPEE
ncbi:hypothetical protein LPJ61_003751 [Coemansia biformis]|uniref:Uncharacterized protein n=1 Tax=Coemansia biformis TaxID=1286918 RepID=A0A9W7YC84_9FUNG|nr:hypothetical protein LPJ61_003751 [Coemansia biformis]